MNSIPEKPRKMKPIPISSAKGIAKAYGYDQVVIMARRVGDETEINGEHITTYGITPQHCDVAALMGNKLKAIAGWPERQDYDAVWDMMLDLEDGIFDYDDYDKRKNQIDALRRILDRTR